MLLFCAGILAIAAAAGAGDLSPYASPQRLTAIDGGRRLNLYCAGAGTPTVVLISGLGLKYTGTLAWYKVQPEVRRFARVCSFDRAGLGFSDAGPFPRSAGANANDLASLLRAAHVPPPYLLVAHSLGGFDARLFAGSHLDEVAGMLLVDPVVEGFTAGLERSDADRAAFYAQAKKCAGEAKRGSLHDLDTQHHCIGPPSSNAIVKDDPSIGATVNAALDGVLQSPIPWETFTSEAASAGFIVDSDDTDDRQMSRSRRSFGTMPLIVLTAAETYGGVDQARWIAGHVRIAASSKRGVDCIVSGSGHFIQIEKPSAVVAAIRRLFASTTSIAQLSCEHF